MQISKINSVNNSGINQEFEVIKNKISNPASFGPGIWYCIHRMARDATTNDKKVKFKEFIENMIQNLPCQTCVDHATTYYKSRPLDQFWNMKENGDDIGLFRWSWEFHNTVNQRLKKPIVNWENAKKLFSQEDGVCTSDCGNETVVTNLGTNAPKSSFTGANNISYTISPISPQVSMIKERTVDPLQRFIPKNIIRPNSMEKSNTIKFRI